MTHKRFLLAFSAVVPAALFLGHVAFGGPAVLAIGIAAILLLVARFDNHTGSCLLVTIILLTAVFILIALLMASARIAIH